MKKFMSHRIAIVIVVASLGSAAIATDAAARGGGGASLGGGGMGRGFGGAHLVGAMGGGRVGGGLGDGRFGRFEHGHRALGLAVPLGYYDDGYSGYYDPLTVTPGEQPTYPTTAYPYVKPPRSSCSTQTYKVPSEAGGEASINVVRC